ncbi:coatomer subunit delta-like [Daphnia pulex]|uniref:coatomer subunit delta-like n=1 Tax=Daphnia pulex TaxID=6669 RepID=UPI0002225F94|nr:coatomer subunit delta-like [Daphnia pulex]XP_046635064.1 coatomer subunit delta-like [Daphnia pulicaria]
MVLIAAAVCTKGGKALVSRQFVEMTKSRIEGLLAAFPKLMSSGKAAQQQHTFVETESVRYVYQPLDKVYVLLITTRASNILEDLETLRLFARVVPEYCRTFEESEIRENAFNLIFAFDEIVALGYRENVNLAQIRTFVEMDSHEEKVYQAVRQTQERDAKMKMREKAKELQRQRVESNKRGIKSPISSSGGYGPSPMAASIPTEPPKPTYQPAVVKPNGPSKALKLGGRLKDAEIFVDQLKSEGENVNSFQSPASVVQGGSVSSNKLPPSTIATEPVQLRIEEKLSLSCGRDGGLHNMEIHGLLTLFITDETYGRVRVQVENRDSRGIQIQTHPNVDKELFRTKQHIALKNATKPFPLNTDVGVLKWRFQTQDENMIPLNINCWPAENGRGGCDVNIEFELQDDRLELNDVVIVIPLPHGCGAPNVSECEGEYQYEPRKNQLSWQLPVVDSSNKSGAMEFSCQGHANDFFPINVNFYSKRSYAEISVNDVVLVDDGTSVKYAADSNFFTEKYEIL